ncbi:26S proteasome regulatory complex non-ATPase subcomplex Rpn1 subunit [Infundibulicybe gibba]|nr:26S proteasome regulatory complex non-ATPase subcomplex Rpn1 subunit [Infundibulicybe gibba]
MPQATEFSIKVQSEDPKKKKEDPSEKDKEEGSSKLLKDSKDAKDDGKDGEGEELSEEDLALKNELEMLVERLKESNTDLYKLALETLRTLIRTSTSSMTSVPKPLKFLRPHYPELQTLYETWPASDDKSLFADILSVLAMTYSDTQPRGTLRYRLLSASLRPADSPLADPGTWGHEYVRHLAAELGEEYTIREQEGVKPVSTLIDGQEAEAQVKLPGTIEDLHSLAKQCAKFLLGHNAEPDAVDLLEELEIVDEIAELVDDNTFGRVCQYMIRCVNLLPPPDDIQFLRTAHTIYVQHHKFPQALELAIRLNDQKLVREDFFAPGILAATAFRDDISDPDAGIDFQEELGDDLLECLSNSRLSTHFREFGKEVGVMDAKSLEDVYKSHLDNTRPGTTANVDSARGNLAGTFVNAFVNAGFGNDKLMVEAEEGNSWIYKNKDHGVMSAAASLGLSLLWDTDVGLSHVDKYTYSAEEHIKAGALFATGILNSGVRTEADAAFALLADYVDNKSVPLKTSAIMGLGLAYAGSHREDLLSVLLPHIADDSVSMEVASLAALALGFIFVGSENGETLMEKCEREDKSLDEKWARFMALGLGLLYLGLQDASDATLETLKAIDHPISKTAQIMVEACSFAGTGNVLRVQGMLHHCDGHVDTSKEKEESKDGKDGKDGKDEAKRDDTYQSFAVLAVALIAMGEDIGAEMSLRQFNHLMHYGEPVIRKAVPLAIGLVSTSNPQLPILDTLSKYSHDNDLQVALNAIFAMGLVGAGTNNARLAQMLRQLAGYYYKEPDCLFMVRIAQGLLASSPPSRHLLTQKPVIISFFRLVVLDKYHWMLYFLVTAMYPRFFITLDENLNNVPVTVRVGQALDVVGQAGKPRTISGFQTHQTPVRLGTTERAELATEEFIPFGHVLEGFVILQKNPGWEKEDKMDV